MQPLKSGDVSLHFFQTIPLSLSPHPLLSVSMWSCGAEMGMFVCVSVCVLSLSVCVDVCVCGGGGGGGGGGEVKRERDRG